MSISFPCPCGSQIPYAQCCEPCHLRGNAPTAEALMRSRYSAFALKLVPYLVATTHPDKRTKTLQEELRLTCKRVVWTGLEVLDVWQGEVKQSVGKVRFRAMYVEEGKKGIHEEHARFKRYKGAWTYVDGEVQ